MKRIRCPKCDEPILFDDKLYEPGRSLVFQCPACNKQFKIRIPSPTDKPAETPEAQPPVGYLTVIENAFHLKQVIPLCMGRNVVGRHVRGTTANAAIKTVDPSIDTTHCIINICHNKNASGLKFLLSDAPSNTGTFLMNTLLGVKEQALVEEGAIITIGATTMILHTTPPEDTEV